ncbi:MAG: hypothetical protein ACTS7I_00910 [Candidatus Hodgkinia cicadicola]
MNGQVPILKPSGGLLRSIPNGILNWLVKGNVWWLGGPFLALI